MEMEFATPFRLGASDFGQDAADERLDVETVTGAVAIDIAAGADVWADVVIRLAAERAVTVEDGLIKDAQAQGVRTHRQLQGRRVPCCQNTVYNRRGVGDDCDPIVVAAPGVLQEPVVQIGVGGRARDLDDAFDEGAVDRGGDLRGGRRVVDHYIAKYGLGIAALVGPLHAEGVVTSPNGSPPRWRLTAG